MCEKLYIVVPCYNEEEVLIETSKRLLDKLNRMIDSGLISSNSKIIFVNDDSKDKIWKIIETLHNENSMFSGINLSRNKGHQNALLAGLMVAKDYCDFSISLDADLQDDIEVLDKFVEEYLNGCDIVYGVRSKRETDTFFKRTTAVGFYRFMNKLGVDVVYNHADYRLMSKRALDGLAEFKEVNLFLRGLVPLIGYKSSCVDYERSERFAGDSKYPLKKTLSFTFDGITSFSVKPIRFITLSGALIFTGSIISLILILLNKLLRYTVQGWTSVIASIWWLGGIQLLSIGISSDVGRIITEYIDPIISPIIQYIVSALNFLSMYLTILTLIKIPNKIPQIKIIIIGKYSKFNFNTCFIDTSISAYSPKISSIVDPDIPGKTIADIAIIPVKNIYTINPMFKLLSFITKLLLLPDIGLKYVIVNTIIAPIIKKIISFLFSSKFFSDLTIIGIDAIINPKNKEFISYMFFSNIDVINITDIKNPTIHPTPILYKNLNAFNLSVLFTDIKAFNEFTKSS